MGTQGSSAVRLASFETPYEAEMIRECLDREEIPYRLNRLTEQLAMSVGELASVDIWVAEEDLERARSAIAHARQAGDGMDPEKARRMQGQRRCRIARMVAYVTGVVLVLDGALLLLAGVGDRHAFDLAVGVVLVALARGSASRAREAFGAMFLMVAVVTLWAILAESGLLGMAGFGALPSPFYVIPGLAVLLASYYAHEAAVELAKGS